MVKLTGPGLAAEASGALGAEVIFSNWKGKAYLKQHRKPKQPHTAAQVAMRTMLAFLSSEWNLITAPDQATWHDLAAAAHISPFNAYLAENLRRWRSFLPPSKAYPATENGENGSNTSFFATGGPRNILLGFDPILRRNNWPMAIHFTDAPTGDLKWNNLAHLVPITGYDPITSRITPLDPGTYDLAFRTFTAYGNFDPTIVRKQTTVT